jgi:hypothetical protein
MAMTRECFPRVKQSLGNKLRATLPTGCLSLPPISSDFRFLHIFSVNRVHVPFRLRLCLLFGANNHLSKNSCDLFKVQTFGLKQEEHVKCPANNTCHNKNDVVSNRMSSWLIMWVKTYFHLIPSKPERRDLTDHNSRVVTNKVR